MKYIPPKPNTPEYRKERDKEMKRFRRQRYTHAALAELYGISEQRVAIICKEIKPSNLLKSKLISD